MPGAPWSEIKSGFEATFSPKILTCRLTPSSMVTRCVLLVYGVAGAILESLNMCLMP